MQTFVVRVFRSEHEGAAEDRSLRGVVEDIRAASRTSFSDATQLLAILAQSAPRAETDRVDPGTRPESDRPATH